MKTNSKGFSLIELLIVVAIILIIAAIAIPNLLKSRIAANQASAVGSLRTINTGEITYAATYNVGYSPTLVALGGPGTGAGSATAAGVIDAQLAAGTKSGYTFVYTPSAAVSGSINAYDLKGNPLTVGTTGTNYYFTDQTGVIRQNSTAVAAETDSPIGG